ncbi:hypothetical protein, partial [uncultured Parasutterella sp.]|uniref:hypothetical protein n=1 Tax=uncultured Parasutterella sp. TaxID=1263098 RepID=UPI0026749141
TISPVYRGFARYKGLNTGILMNILIIKKILIILFSVLSIGAVQANETIIKIGLPLVSPPWNTSQFLQQSIHSLSWKLPQYKFEA